MAITTPEPTSSAKNTSSTINWARFPNQSSPSSTVSSWVAELESLATRQLELPQKRRFLPCRRLALGCFLTLVAAFSYLEFQSLDLDYSLDLLDNDWRKEFNFNSTFYRYQAIYNQMKYHLSAPQFLNLFFCSQVLNDTLNGTLQLVQGPRLSTRSRFYSHDFVWQTCWHRKVPDWSSRKSVRRRN